MTALYLKYVIAAVFEIWVAQVQILLFVGFSF